MNLPKTGSILRRLLIVVPVLVALILLVLFMPAQRLTIEGIGMLSFETTVTLSVGYEAAYASPGWVSPTGFVDGGSVWTSETLAYDEGTGTYAYADALKSDWTDYLELTHAALDCDKVQLWVDHDIANINQIQVDVYYSSAWHNIFSDAPSWGAWQEHTIGSTQSVTALRVRFFSTKASTGGCRVHEADFNEVVPLPDISNLPTSKNFGLVNTSTDYWSNGSAPTWPLDDGECYFTVTNNSSQAVNIDIRATDFSGGTPGWTLAGTPGADAVVLKTGKSGDSLETNMVTLTTGDQAFITALGASASIKWELKMETPISFSNGDPKTSTITLTATFV